MAINKRPGWLIETCLLTFGLPGISCDRMERAWTLSDEHMLCWVRSGRIKIGPMREYLPFRNEKDLKKIDRDHLDSALAQGDSGALTASATMEVCYREGIDLAVSCGIGGIGDIKGEELCPDLPTLRDLPVSLIAASPKDMLDRAATIAWLREAGVSVVGAQQTTCTGYVFCGEPIPLDGALDLTAGPLPGLILQPIPELLRLTDRTMLDRAVSRAKEAEARGEQYHPAANAALDQLSEGYSSWIQLKGLMENALLAQRIAEHYLTRR